MAQTSPWLSLADASSRLGIPEYQVLALAVSGRVRSRLEGGNHRELCASAVEEFASEMDALASEAAHGGDDLAENVKPIWTPWSAADDPEARAEQADFDDDTPNEEGDEN